VLAGGVGLAGEFRGRGAGRRLPRRVRADRAAGLPAPARVHRTALARQAADPCRVGRRLPERWAGRPPPAARRFARAAFCARFAGRENAETVSGSVPALKFVVDGHSAYDGSFEIWLDPARGYLPAHAASRNSAGEAEFELLLQRADP